MAVAFTKRGLKGAPRLDVIKKALALRLDKPSGEIIRKDLLEKADGKFRLIYSFGPLEYARQYLVLRVLQIFVPISGSQFMHSGGTCAAARWLKANVRSRTWVTTTDIPDCFLRQSRVSLESGGLLPKPVMTSVLYDAMRMAKQGISKVGGELASPLQQEVYSDVGPAPERGIPPGSAPSSLLAEASLGELARTAESAAEGVLVGNYLDNFIILAPSKKAADVTFETLCQAILTEYGPEAVAQVRHRRKTTQARAGFSFLGDQYIRKGKALVRRMEEDTVEMFKTRLAVTAADQSQSLEKIERRISGWEAARQYDPAASLAASEMRALYKPMLGSYP